MIKRLMRGTSVLLFTAVAACATDEQTANEQAPDSLASVSATERRDLETLSSYELSMEDLERWAQANVAVSKVVRQQPELEAQMAINAEDASIDTLAARMEAVPPVKEAIESSGLSAHRFATITYTIMQVAMAQLALQQGVPADSFAARGGINPRNLEFYVNNRIEIDRLMQQLKETRRR